MEKPSLKHSRFLSTVQTTNMMGKKSILNSSKNYIMSSRQLFSNENQNDNQPMVNSFNSNFSFHQKPINLNRESVIRSRKAREQAPMLSQLSQLSQKNKMETDKNTSIKPYYEPTVNKVSWVDTHQIEHSIKKSINADQELSSDHFKGRASPDNYRLEFEKISIKYFESLPKVLKQAFENQLSMADNDQQVHVAEGYLHQQNILYYVINRQLFLLPIEVLKLKKDLRFEPILLKDRCFGIYQVPVAERNLSNGIYPQEFCQKLLALVFPFSIQICAYCQNDGGLREGLSTFPMQKSPLEFIDLKINLNLETQKAQFIKITEKGDIIYIDSKSRVNCYELKQLDKGGKVRKGARNIKQVMSLKRNFIAKNESLIKSSFKYFKAVLSVPYSLFLQKRRNMNLIYDEKSSRIYSLTNRTPQRQNPQQSLKKEIKVYSFCLVSKQIKCLWVIPEEQLIDEINNILISKITSRIFNIQKVAREFSQQIDLAVMFQNGIKIHLQIELEKIKILKIGAMLGLKELSQVKQMRSSEEKMINSKKAVNMFLSKDYKVTTFQERATKLRQSYNSNFLNIQIASRQSQLFLHLIDKDMRPSSSQAFSVQTITLPQKFRRQNRVPAQNFIFQTSQSFNIPQSCKHILSHQTSLEQVRVLKSQIHNCHQLLRQVHYSSRNFIYCSEMFICEFTVLRPIDIVFSFLQNFNQYCCLQYLPLVLGVTPEQICCMLIQIYSSESAQYLISLHFAERLKDLFKKANDENNSSNSSILRGQAFMRSSRTTSYFNNNSNNYNSADQSPQSSPPQKPDIIQSYKMNKEILLQKKSFILKLIESLSLLQAFNGSQLFSKISLNSSKSFENQDSSKNNVYSAVCLYISRVLHPVWKVHIQGKNFYLTIKGLISKISQLRELCDLLQKIGVSQNKQKQLKFFLSKITQLLCMAQIMPFLLQMFTLESLLQKQISLFQPHLFKAIRKQYKDEIYYEFEKLFPIFITERFRRIYRVYNQIKNIHHVGKIMEILKDQTYPEYFVDYLIYERQLKGATIFKAGNASSLYQPMRVVIPKDIPVNSQIQYIFNKVQYDLQLPLSQKQLYLKAAQQLLNEELPNGRQSQLQSQHKDLHCLLKLQMEFRNEFISQLNKTIHPQNKNSILSSIKSIWNLFFTNNSLFEEKSKLSFGYGSQQQLLYSQLQKQDKIGYDDIEMLNRINYMLLDRHSLLNMIEQIGNVRLQLVYVIMFQYSQHASASLSTNRKQYTRDKMIALWSKMVEQTFVTLQVDKKSTNSSEMNKIGDTLKLQIRKVIQLLNTVGLRIPFAELSKGLAAVFAQMNYVRESFKTKKPDMIIFEGVLLASLAYSPSKISDYFILQLNHYLLIPKVQLKNLPIDIINQWLYLFYNLQQLCKEHIKKIAPEVVTLAEEFIEIFAEEFQKQEGQKKKRAALQKTLNHLKEKMKEDKSYI